MKIHTLELVNFRNHKNVKIDFGGTSTIILGQNGTGKTNILEAISMLSTAKSLRADFDREVISHEENHTHISAGVEPNGDPVLLEISIAKNLQFENASSKKVKLNKVAKSLNNFIGVFNTVLFTPHDVEIFTNSPSVRRKHLDYLFFQVDKEYKKATTEYTKALRQRNKLLERIRDFGMGKDQMDFWTEKIIKAGQIIQSKRDDFFAFASESVSRHGKKLDSPNTTLEIVYDKNEISEARIESYHSKEFSAARTLIGPHRDDFHINFNAHDMAKFGSRGQKRATVLALKLCEIDFIHESVGKRPVLLLDDIFSELDEKHQNSILNIVDMQQTIITSANKDNKNLGLNLIEI